jgi:predicted esterase
MHLKSVKVLCLHGFSQNARKMERLLQPLIPPLAAQGCTLHCIDAPFELENATSRSWWKMKDGVDGKCVYEGYEISLDVIREAVRAGGHTCVLGFSQGGCLAPLVAAEIPEIDCVISIGGFPPRDPALFAKLGERTPAKSLVIAGSHDKIVPAAFTKRLATMLGPDSIYLEHDGGHVPRFLGDDEASRAIQKVLLDPPQSLI